MRSASGTKSGEPGVVTFVTNEMTAALAAPSFQEGRGSPAVAWTGAIVRSKEKAKPANRLRRPIRGWKVLSTALVMAAFLENTGDWAAFSAGFP
jgi:hypothetical protein